MSISNSKSLKCSNIHQIVQISKNSHYSKTRLHDKHAKIDLIHKLNKIFYQGQSIQAYLRTLEYKKK